MITSRSQLSEQTFVPGVTSSTHPLLNEPVPTSLWRGILLVEPEITLLTAQALLLTRSDYSVTPAFSQLEIFILREKKAIALAILSDGLGPRLLAVAAHSVRKQWPLARILVIGRPQSVLEDHLYDEQVDHSSDPKQLLEDVERLYSDSWNQRSYTLNWDVRRAGTSAARSLITESDPRKDLAPARTVARTFRGTPSGVRNRPSPDPASHKTSWEPQAVDVPLISVPSA